MKAPHEYNGNGDIPEIEITRKIMRSTRALLSSYVK